MRCTLLNGNLDRPVTLRNYSSRGLLFETTVQIMPGTFIMLRSVHASEAANDSMAKEESARLEKAHNTAKMNNFWCADGK